MSMYAIGTSLLCSGMGVCRVEDRLVLLKKLGHVDARYQKLAERLVCEEFAAALDTTPDSMKGRLYAAMEEKTA